jgi:aspartate aminotransferase
MATTWTFPNAIMQYALPALERQSIDVAQLQRRRDFMVDALLTMGYRVNRPQGTFYLFPRTPIADDVAFTRRLAEHGILALPGTVFETPGFFRLCLTATDDVCERALPGFERVMGDG